MNSESNPTLDHAQAKWKEIHDQHYGSSNSSTSSRNQSESSSGLDGYGGLLFLGPSSSIISSCRVNQIPPNASNAIINPNRNQGDRK
jgi:hypothetical protein